MRRALIGICVSGMLFAATAGSAGAATITPTSGASFGSVEVGTTSPAKTFTLTLGMELTFTPAIAATPPFSQTNDCGILNPAIPTCTISVTLNPPDTGNYQGTLTAGGNSNTVMLVGTGIAPPGQAKKCKAHKRSASAAKKKCKKKKKK